jgi:hypothetical protein
MRTVRSVVIILLSLLLQPLYGHDLSFGERLALYNKWIHGKATEQEREIAQQTIKKDASIAAGIVGGVIIGGIAIGVGCPYLVRKWRVSPDPEAQAAAQTIGEPIQEKLGYPFKEACCLSGKHNICIVGDGKYITLHIQQHQNDYSLDFYKGVKELVTLLQQPGIEQITVLIGTPLLGVGPEQHLSDSHAYREEYKWTKGFLGWQQSHRTLQAAASIEPTE